MCCNSSEIACRALLGVFLLDILMSGLVLFCIATVISFIAIGWGTWGKNRSHNNALQFPTRLSSLSLSLPRKKIGQSYIFQAAGFLSSHILLLTYFIYEKDFMLGRNQQPKIQKECLISKYETVYALHSKYYLGRIKPLLLQVANGLVP